LEGERHEGCISGLLGVRLMSGSWDWFCFLRMLQGAKMVGADQDRCSKGKKTSSGERFSAAERRSLFFPRGEALFAKSALPRMPAGFFLRRGRRLPLDLGQQPAKPAERRQLRPKAPAGKGEAYRQRRGSTGLLGVGARSCKITTSEVRWPRVKSQAEGEEPSRKKDLVEKKEPYAVQVEGKFSHETASLREPGAIVHFLRCLCAAVGAGSEKDSQLGYFHPILSARDSFEEGKSLMMLACSKGVLASAGFSSALSGGGGESRRWECRYHNVGTPMRKRSHGQTSNTGVSKGFLTTRGGSWSSEGILFENQGSSTAPILERVHVKCTKPRAGREPR